MTKVEILGSNGWRPAGDYTPDRARRLAELLRLAGAIVRVEGEHPVRGRIHWRFESVHSTWVGGIDGIELFTIVVAEQHSTLFPALPGYRKGKVCSSPPIAQDMAERVLNQFIMRLGVRGLDSTASTTTDTIELDPAMLAEITGEDRGD